MIGGVGQCRQLRLAGAQTPQQLLATAVGQVGIDQAQVQGLRHRQGLGLRARAQHGRRQRLQRQAHEFVGGGVVFDQQDPWRHGRAPS